MKPPAQDRCTPEEIEFLRAFESCTLPPDAFDHTAHIRMAWICLHEAPLLAALQRVSSGLQRFAAAAGMPQRYHETVTWAFVFLIHERIERTGRDAGWAAFALHNQDLLARTGPYGVLGAYYHEETLRSDLARRVYLLPDRALPAPAG